MSWQQEIDEIRKRRIVALGMGGLDRVAKQHAQRKKSARERLDLLLDPGSFTELGLLATHQSQRPEMQGVHTAADGFFRGFRPVILEDAATARTEDGHRLALASMQRLYGAQVVTSDKFFIE